MKYFIIALALFLASCNSGAEEDHAHDAEGNHVAGEIPSISHTVWTDSTELFVEFPLLTVGQVSRFAAHFTVLEKHKPVTEGSVTVSLIKDGKGIRNTAEAPSSPGIFTPSLEPKEAGVYQLVFDLKTPSYSDRIVLQDIQVYPDAEAAIAAAPAEEEAAISFLKEQAWKMQFQTAPVTEGEVYEVVHTSGVWKATPGTYTSIAASANGMVRFATEQLTEGTAVKKGQLLMTLSSEGLASNNLSTEVAQARTNFEQAKAEYERKKELFEAQIVPRAEFEKVQSNYKIAESTYRSLASGYGPGGKQIRAPFDGFIKSLDTGNGAYVEQGDELISIGTDRSRLLETQVSSSYRPSMENIQNVWYRTDNGWTGIKETGGSILSVGKEVETGKPMVPIYVNAVGTIEAPEGSFTEVQIALGSEGQGTLVPEAALLEDYGNFLVIVQTGGESFERRPVQIGKRNGQQVQVLTGLEPGEIVVTTGAYQVMMASMSGQAPAHGHAH